MEHKNNGLVFMLPGNSRKHKFITDKIKQYTNLNQIHVLYGMAPVGFVLICCDAPTQRARVTHLWCFGADAFGSLLIINPVICRVHLMYEQDCCLHSIMMTTKGYSVLKSINPTSFKVHP